VELSPDALWARIVPRLPPEPPKPEGAELVGEVAQYEDRYRLCYMRGPAGIIVALAEELF
jgi:hypothetical protein